MKEVKVQYLYDKINVTLASICLIGPDINHLNASRQRNLWKVQAGQKSFMFDQASSRDLIIGIFDAEIL